jgi:hypothetical protein
LLGFVNGVEAEEGEEQVGCDSFHARAVCHDQAGVDAFQRSARDDDGDFVDGVAHGCPPCGLDAAARLGDAADLGGQLRRALGKQLVQLL